MRNLFKPGKGLGRFSNVSKEQEKLILKQEALLALIPDIIMEADLNRVYTWTNQPGYDFFGDDVLGRTADYYFIDDQDVEKALNPLINGNEETVYIESWQRRKDGRKRLLAWWCKSAKDNEGRVIGTVSTARDITAEKNNEVNLLKKTIEIESFFTYSLELLCIADSNGSFRQLSRYWSEVLGYGIRDLIGKNIIELVHPEDLLPTVETIRSVLAKQHITNFRNRYLHKNGTYRWLEWSFMNVGDAIYASARDITEQLKTNEILRLSEARYRNMVQNSPIVNYQIDKNGVFIVSEGKGLTLLNLKPGEVVGLSVYEVYEDYPTILDSFEKALNGEKSEITVSVNGRVFETFMEPVFNLKNEISSVIGVAIDHTERFLAEEKTNQLNFELEVRVKERTAQLAAINEELETLADSISQDLTTPLRAIEGFTQILIDEYDDSFSKERRRLFGIIQDNIFLMKNLITDLLTLTRISRNEIRPISLNMNALVAQCIQQLIIPEISNEFTLEIGDLPRTLGDRDQILVTWNHLISNAIKFSMPSENKHIIITGKIENGQSYYTVQDFGIGFSQENSYKLFGVFQRLNKSTDFPGNGIGLAIVKRIIHRHGGQVGATGSPGKGASFWFSLPNKMGTETN